MPRARALAPPFRADPRRRYTIEELTGERYVYPNAAVVCGRPVYDRLVPTAVLNPLLVAEVQSPSSEAYDAGEKFDYHAALESLRAYVLVAQDRPRVEVRARADAGADWTTTVTEDLDGQAEPLALGDALPLREVYRLVEF